MNLCLFTPTHLNCLVRFGDTSTRVYRCVSVANDSCKTAARMDWDNFGGHVFHRSWRREFKWKYHIWIEKEHRSSWKTKTQPKTQVSWAWNALVKARQITIHWGKRTKYLVEFFVAVQVVWLCIVQESGGQEVSVILDELLAQRVHLVAILPVQALKFPAVHEKTPRQVQTYLSRNKHNITSFTKDFFCTWFHLSPTLGRSRGGGCGCTPTLTRPCTGY